MPSDNLVQEVLEAARILFHSGDLVEVRVPKAGRHRTISGYFQDFEKMAAAVAELESTRPAYPGIYWTLNPVVKDLAARGDNRLVRFASNATTDLDIVTRRWLPVDLDPKRPTGISSTDAEHQCALDLADRIEAALLSDGWPVPIVADSGNGAHLLYAIDLPNTPDSEELLRGCLAALAGIFNTEDPHKIEVDLTTFNASRIFKTYGTTARKGDSTPDRPHRVSQILRVPALIAPVAPELLRALAAKAAKPKPKASAKSSSSARGARAQFNLRSFLDRHGIRYREPVPHDGGFKFTLESCPFDPSHQNKDAAVFERNDGYGFKCFHSSCANRGWKEFRELFEPDAYAGRGAGGRPRAPHPADEFREEEEQSEAVDVKNEVDEAIKQGNLDAVLLMIPEIAKLPALTVLRIKSALAEKFKRKFRPGDFEKAIREERRRGIAGLPPEDPSLPVIIVNNRPMRDVVADSLTALRAANDPPFLFVRSGQMVFIETDERDRPSIQAVEKAHLRGRLDRAANYIRRGSEADIAVAPPVEVVEDILALPSARWGVPPLEFVVEVPTLRPDGTVLSSPGYDPKSRMLYAPPPGFTMKPIPAYVDSEQLRAAVALIDEAICDFPFADEKDESGVAAPSPSRANFFGLLLTPIVRPAFSGCVPLALIDAPQAGTGKSLLVDLFSIIVTGRSAAMMPFPRNEDEMQKSIGATLLAGRALVCFDNIEGMLQSPTLALVITAKEYEARILGVSENMVAPNRATWVATGNNIRPGGDMPRRCYVIKLDARKSRPYQGRKFRHENLLDWAREVRPQLLRSLLIVAMAWYQRKVKVPVADPWGSFEDWHRTVAGILRSAEIEGFLGNLQSFLTEADDMALQWEGFLRELDQAFETEWFTVGQIVREIRSSTALAPARFTLPDSLADVDRRKEGSLERSLGKSFAKRLGTRYGETELHLARRFQAHTKQAEWRVLTHETEGSAPKGAKASPRQEVIPT